MDNFKGSGRGSKGRGFGGGGSFFKDRGRGGDRDREREMFRTTCSQCGRSCEVPFRPTGEKPVYCNSCFGAMKDSDDSRPQRSSFGGDRNGGFRERGNSRHENRPASGNDDLKKQLSDVSSKLDKLISVVEKLSSAGLSKPVATEKVAEEIATKAVSEKKVEEKPTKKVVKKKVASKAK